jgi:hypothetical protein
MSPVARIPIRGLPIPPLAVVLVVSLGATGCASRPEGEVAAEFRSTDRLIKRWEAERRRDPQPLEEGWPTFCTAHGRRLREDVVPIGYGLHPAFRRPKLREASQTLFPFASTYAWGGCCIEEGDPERAHVKFCPDCRQARRRYYRDNPMPFHRTAANE